MSAYRVVSLRTKLHPQEDGESGFTLIEMLVAIAILSGAMVTILACFSWSLRAVQDAKLAMEARVLAQTLLAQAYGADAQSIVREGVTGTGLSWRVRVRPYGAGSDQKKAQAAVVVADVDWIRQHGTKHYSLETLIFLQPLPR